MQWEGWATCDDVMLAHDHASGTGFGMLFVRALPWPVMHVCFHRGYLQLWALVHQDVGISMDSLDCGACSVTLVSCCD